MNNILKFFIVILLCSFGVNANDNMFIHGTLIAPPCYISNNNVIEVPFGTNLAIKKIDGQNFMAPVEYQINCDEGYKSGSIAIVIETANPAVFDSSAINTDKNGLGIRILVNNQPVVFGQRIAVNDISSPPKVEAVPVKDPAATLSEGAFEATVMLRTDYL